MERGSSYLLVNSTSPQHPLGDDQGGSTTTASASGLATATRCQVYGFTVLTAHTSGTTLTVYGEDGTTVLFTRPVAANQAAPLYIPIGGPTGRKVSRGISAKTSHTNMTGELDFDRADGRDFDA